MKVDNDGNHIISPKFNPFSDVNAYRSAIVDLYKTKVIPIDEETK